MPSEHLICRNLEVIETNPTLGSSLLDESTMVKIDHVAVYLVSSSHWTK